MVLISIVITMRQRADLLGRSLPAARAQGSVGTVARLNRPLFKDRRVREAQGWTGLRWVEADSKVGTSGTREVQCR
jgi:hypothetical protein